MWQEINNYILNNLRSILSKNMKGNLLIDMLKRRMKEYKLSSKWKDLYILLMCVFLIGISVSMLWNQITKR